MVETPRGNRVRRNIAHLHETKLPQLEDGIVVYDSLLKASNNKTMRKTRKLHKVSSIVMQINHLQHHE